MQVDASSVSLRAVLGTEQATLQAFPWLNKKLFDLRKKYSSVEKEELAMNFKGAFWEESLCCTDHLETYHWETMD